MLRMHASMLQGRFRLPAPPVNRYRLTVALPIFSKNGEILPIEQATVPLSDIAYAYGFGVYENIRAVRGRALFLNDHLERLMLSARVIGLEHTFGTGSIAAWVEELLKKIEAEACNLKVLLIGGKDQGGATLFIVPLAPLFPDKRLYQHGAKALTVRHERYLPQAKTLNMLPSFLAYRTAKDAGCYDALFVDHAGCITEGTRTNFFTIKDRTILSPPEKDILEGVTLKHVLAVGSEHGFAIEHRPIPLKDITTFDGAFLTSTSSKIMPLSQIDAATLSIPAALGELMEHFERFQKTAQNA